MSKYIIAPDGRCYITLGSGKTIEISRVAQGLLEAVKKAYPPPEPPLNTVERPDGTFVQERNESNPDYLRARRDWETDIEDKGKRLLIKKGAKPFLPTDPIEREAAQLKVEQELNDAVEFMRREFGIELDVTDRTYAWILNVAMCGDQDYMDLASAISGRSNPTEGAIVDGIARFQSEVQG